ncbi:hypothetical protein GW814_03270, partial [Candidatus Falkowbacteria bacterium]|nr:hypothetical protein [Candidatus Falkowbacteria bacterium]
LSIETESLERGGEQGSRTPSAERRTFHVSNGGAPASALLSSDRRNFNDNTENNFGQNKNISVTGGEDVLAGPLADEVPPSDTYLYNSTSQNPVKFGSWTKVKYLKPGQEIAVVNTPFNKGGKGDLMGEVGGSAVWDKIIKI